MSESVDKMSIQLALVFVTYLLAYGVMYLLGNVLLGETSNLIGTIYGFNFLFGVIMAVLVKGIMNAAQKHNIIHREYKNAFLLNRISGFAFDLMIVAGICAIRIDLISNYIGVILLLGAAGALVSFFYLRFVCKHIFPAYAHEQFMAFFGMLTGTASTGMILLREADRDLTTPVSENLVYQNFPAIILALPLLYIAGQLTAQAASLATAAWILLLIIGIFVVLNLFLFRSRCLCRKKGADADGAK